MFRKYTMLFLIAGIIVLSGCPQEPSDISSDSDNPTEAYRVATAVNYHFDNGKFLRIDIRFPEVISELPFAAEINDMMRVDHPDIGEDLSQRWSTVEGHVYTWYQMDYIVFDNNDGICSINILDTVSSVTEDIVLMEWVFPYYFNSNSGAVLTKEEYLNALGVNPDELIDAYIREFYSDEDVKINLEYLLFYFDEKGNLHFIFNEMAKVN